MTPLNACFVSAFFSASCLVQAEERAAFALVQPELLSAALSMTHAWADFDNDGDLDLHVGFRSGIPNRLYRNDDGILVDVAPELGVADREDTRAAAWGDYNADGLLDLYVGYAAGDPENPLDNRNRIYRNDGSGFTEVSKELGLQLPAGNARQVSWIDYDADGDIDLFVGFRSIPNRLFRNVEGVFSDVSEEMGISGSRATMGGVWFDFDQDGDLDLYLGNADGFGNRMYRNDKVRFVDVAAELGIDGGGRVLELNPGSHDMSGTVRADITDYDNDGDFDLYVTNRKGTDGFYRNDSGHFLNIAEEMGMSHPQYRGTAAWADFNNDGWIDVYVHKTLYANTAGTFTKVTPRIIEENIGGYGNIWTDFDSDGAVDLSLSLRNHYIFRNLLSEGDEAGGVAGALRADRSGVGGDGDCGRCWRGGELRGGGLGGEGCCGR